MSPEKVETAGYPLTDAQIALYRENGFVQLPDVLTPGELEDLRSALDALIERHRQAHPSDDSEYRKIFLQMVNLWCVDEGIRRFTLNRRVAEIARRLVGVSRLRLWHDHALVKMPGDSRLTPWHQDLVYWPMHEDGALSCWMALDDVDEHNGCMHFIPGSHHVGRLEPIRLVNPQDIFALAGARGVSPADAVRAELRAGSCTFHDGRTFHHASANHSTKPRRAMIVIYMADGTTYNGKRHVVTDPLDLRVDEPLAGEMFPIVAEE